MSAAVRTTLNGVERDWFAFSLGGYRRGAEAGTEVVQGGRTDGVAYEAAVRRAASVPDYLGPEASPDACAAACASDWPRCKAWTWSRRASGADALPACSFVPRLGGGELVPAPAAVSGTVVERDRQPGSRVWTDRARSRADGRGKKAAGAGIA
ncbi:hypothetical protein DFJ74DRAFT_650521 [Hyaloraphidium curvatum]|nr:hypothetical protein DFJ74DRAFT_650521 [Hyaloraphidium curvatum]